MPNEDFTQTLALARRKLAPAATADRAPLRALAAAAFFAVSALTFAASAILAPPVEHAAPARPGVD